VHFITTPRGTSAYNSSRLAPLLASKVTAKPYALCDYVGGPSGDYEAMCRYTGRRGDCEVGVYFVDLPYP